MNRLVIYLVMVVVMVGVVRGEGPELVIQKVWNGGFDMRVGVASYSDQYDNFSGASYVQIPVVDWGNFFISFGGVVPFEHIDRSRPEFSLCTSVSHWVDCPIWMNFELGAYIAVSPYGAYGGQVGLINIRF